MPLNSYTVMAQASDGDGPATSALLAFAERQLLASSGRWRWPSVTAAPDPFLPSRCVHRLAGSWTI